MASDLDALIAAAERLATGGRTRAPRGEKSPGERRSPAVWCGLAIALAAVLVAFGIPVYRAVTARSAPVLATEVAQVGRELAAYVRETGRPPENLGALSAFPKDAIEMPADAYTVRLLEPRLEFFLFRNTAGRAIVVGRRGDEAWAFDPGGRQELFRVPAH